MGRRSVERIDDVREADERVLEHLTQLGCDPSTPRETRHFLSVPDRPGAKVVAAKLSEDGWETSISPCGDGVWLVEAWQTRSLTPEVVRDTRDRFELLAADHRGLYEGWEAAR